MPLTAENVARANRAILLALANARVPSASLFKPVLAEPDGSTTSDGLRRLLFWCDKVRAANATTGASLQHIVDAVRLELAARGEPDAASHPDASRIALHELCATATSYVAATIANRHFHRTESFEPNDPPGVGRARRLASRLRDMAVQDQARGGGHVAHAQSHERLADELIAAAAAAES